MSNINPMMYAGSAGEQALKDSQKSGNVFNGSCFFKPGVNSAWLGNKLKGMVRILPSFDPDYYGKDEQFKYGYIPFIRNDYEESEKDPDTNGAPFTFWYSSHMAYRAIGRKLTSFISPLSRHGGDNKDPYQQCFFYCWNKVNKDNDKSFEQYYSKKLNSNAPIHRAVKVAFVNALIKDPESNKIDQVILGMTDTALVSLKKHLTEHAGRADAVINPDFEMLRYGDVTDPKTGSWLYPREIVTPSGNNPTGLWVNTKENTLIGRIEHSFDPESPEGKSILAKRYHVWDLDNLYDVWSFEKITDFIIEEGKIPYNIVKEACIDFYSGTFPSEPPSARGATFSTPSPTNNPFEKKEKQDEDIFEQTKGVSSKKEEKPETNPTVPTASKKKEYVKEEPKEEVKSEEVETPSETEDINNEMTKLMSLITSGKATPEQVARFSELASKQAAG